MGTSAHRCCHPPRYSDKLLRLFALLRPMLSLDKSPACPLSLAAPGLQVAAARHTLPQAKGSRHRRLSRWHVCHLCHIMAASRRRGPPPFRLRSEPRQRAAFRTESSGYTLAGVAPGRKPYYGDRTSCTPSTGHGPRHSAWEGFRTIRLYQELSLGGGRIALGLPRLLIARPPSRPKSPRSACWLINCAYNSRSNHGLQRRQVASSVWNYDCPAL